MFDFAAARGPRLTLDPSSVMDIGACVVDGVDLSPKEAVPDDGDVRISHSVQGFLFTCGPDHIRHPEPIAGAPDGARYPLHGSAAGHEARLVALGGDAGGVECRAVIDIATADGQPARIERQWRIDGESGEVHLRDRLVNIGTEPMPAFLMYHMNIGGRHLDEGTRLEGAMLEQGGFGWQFGERDGGLFCVPAPATEAGMAEIRLGPMKAIGGKTLRVRVLADTLPHLQIWRNQKKPVDVLGIEPVSHRWVGREELRRAGEFVWLQPGESRTYGLSFAFAGLASG